MSKVVAYNKVTPDGVTQPPAGPEEDRRDRYIHGGWAA